MLSHQPEVGRLIHQEHVQRLAGAARQTVQHRHLPSPRITQRLSGLAVLAPTALDDRQP